MCREGAVLGSYCTKAAFENMLWDSIIGDKCPRCGGKVEMHTNQGIVIKRCENGCFSLKINANKGAKRAEA